MQFLKAQLLKQFRNDRVLDFYYSTWHAKNQSSENASNNTLCHAIDMKKNTKNLIGRDPPSGTWCICACCTRFSELRIFSENDDGKICPKCSVIFHHRNFYIKHSELHCLMEIMLNFKLFWFALFWFSSIFSFHWLHECVHLTSVSIFSQMFSLYPFHMLNSM